MNECVIKCNDLSTDWFGRDASGKIVLSQFPAQTPNTSPTGTILTTGVDGHTIDVATQCEITGSVPGGIKLADTFYDGLTPAANIESVVNETAAGIYGTDGGFVTKNLVKRNGCKIEVYSPAEHTTKVVPIPYVANSTGPTGSVAAFTTISTAITTATLTNNTNRTMNYVVDSLLAYGLSNSVPSTNFKTLYRMFVDNGGGTFNLTAAYFDTASVPAGASSALRTPAMGRPAILVNTLAAGASVTIRLQATMESFDATAAGIMDVGVSGNITAWTI